MTHVYIHGRLILKLPGYDHLYKDLDLIIGHTRYTVEYV